MLQLSFLELINLFLSAGASATACMPRRTSAHPRALSRLKLIHVLKSAISHLGCAGFTTIHARWVTTNQEGKDCRVPHAGMVLPTTTLVRPLHLARMHVQYSDVRHRAWRSCDKEPARNTALLSHPKHPVFVPLVALDEGDALVNAGLELLEEGIQLLLLERVHLREAEVALHAVGLCGRSYVYVRGWVNYALAVNASSQQVCFTNPKGSMCVSGS